jgi:hypothetical protein
MRIWTPNTYKYALTRISFLWVFWGSSIAIFLLRN